MRYSCFITSFFLAIGFALTVSACGALYEGSAEQEADDTQRAQTAESNQTEKALPLYKSGVSVNVFSGYASNDFGLAVGGRATYNFANRLTLGAAYTEYFNFAFFCHPANVPSRRRNWLRLSKCADCCAPLFASGFATV